MIVLGYNGFSASAEVFGRLYRRSGIDRNRVLGHDAGAAIAVGGDLVAAVEEERLSRVKRTSAFPTAAIRYCLDAAGIGLDQVDRFAFPWDFGEAVMDGAIDQCMRGGASAKERLVALGRLSELHAKVISREAIRRDFEAQTGHVIPDQKLVLVPHHLAHLMCGYHLAGRPDAAFMISDGRAEQYSSVLGEIDGDSITIFDELSIGIGDSLGLLYSKITRYLGFMPNNDEYKVMGLSAYHTGREHNPVLARLVELHPDGTFSLGFTNQLYDDQAYYGLFDEIFARRAHEDELAFKARVAHAAQEAVEVVTRHQLEALLRRTNKRTLLLEGGVALNCVNNRRLLEGSPFEDAHVSFGASDPGVAIGAAFFPPYADRTAPDLGRRGPSLASPYLGPRYDAADVQAALARCGDRISYASYAEAELLDRVVDLLRQGAVVGFFHGRCEFGPRALGNRSILADPSFGDMQDIINRKVKKREPFRPFAPVVLEDRASEVFDMGKKRASPYMTFVFPVRPEFAERIRGACHVDHTARAQTISARDNPRLASLLARFEERTSIPCLINTSFNVAGEPIVCSPDDALRCFLGTEIDVLVLEDTIVRKRGGPREGPTGES